MTPIGMFPLTTRMEAFGLDLIFFEIFRIRNEPGGIIRSVFSFFVFGLASFLLFERIVPSFLPSNEG